MDEDFSAMCFPLKIVCTPSPTLRRTGKGPIDTNREIQGSTGEKIPFHLLRSLEYTGWGFLNLLPVQGRILLELPTPGGLAWPAATIVWGPGFGTAAHRHHSAGFFRLSTPDTILSSNAENDTDLISALPPLVGGSIGYSSRFGN